MSLACSLKVSDHFADSAASIEFAEPCGGVCICIIRSFLLLNIYEDNRNIQIPYCREHVVGCCVCEKLEDDKVNVSCAEQIAGFLSLFLCCHHTAVDDLDCIRDICLLEIFVLSFELGNELRELGKISAERD